MFSSSRKGSLLYELRKIVFSHFIFVIYDTGILSVTRGYKAVTRGYEGLKGVTGGYKGLQGVTRGNKG